MNGKLTVSRFLLALLGLVSAALVISCQYQSPGKFGPGDIPSFASNGQRIYFTATNDKGGRITSHGFNIMGRSFACA